MIGKKKNQKNNAPSEQAEELSPQKAEKKKIKKRLEKLKSTQMAIPIADIKDGIILTRDGRYICVLEFAPINFLLRTPDEQDQVADAFGSLLRLIPSKIQIKVLSRKANVEAHIREVQSHMASELNENCRIMQEDTIDLIRSNAEHGITRRFIVSFAYEQPPGLRRPGWDAIRSSMFSTAQKIIRFLSSPPCENALLHKLGDTDHVIGLLYDCLCRSQAEVLPLDIKCAEIVNSFVGEGRAKPGQFIPVQEFIAPDEIDPSHYRYLKIDGKYYAFAYILGNSYPDAYVSGWMSQYVSMGAGIDLDLFISREPKDLIQSSMVYSQRFVNVRLRNTDTTNADYDDIRKQAGAGYYLKNGMSEGHEFCYFTTMLTITADSIPELDAKVRNVQSTIVGSNMRLRVMAFSHMEAFESVLPLCKPMKSVIRNGRRNALSADLGSLYPFTSYEVNDVGGIMLGTNIDNGSPVFINAFNRAIYESANMAIMGSTGKGKTFLSQAILLRLRQQGVKVIAIAPIKGHEYRRACKAIGGSFIDFGPGSPHTINIMEIRKRVNSVKDAYYEGEEQDQSSLLLEHIPRIHTFIRLLYPNISEVETNQVDQAILRTYRKFGITEKNPSLLDPKNPGKFKKMPTLKDLHDELKQNRNSRDNNFLLHALTPYVDGSCNSFNGQTNVELNNLYTVLNLSKLEGKMLTIGTYIVSLFVSDACEEDIGQRKVVLFDEVWKLIGSAGNVYTALFVQELIKTLRALNACAILTTQDIIDFFALDNGSYGKTILNNTKIKFILGITLEDQAEMIRKQLNLSREEKNRIMNYEKGEALLVANRNHIEINVEASDNETAVITTDPDTLARLQKHIRVNIDERSR